MGADKHSTDSLMEIESWREDNYENFKKEWRAKRIWEKMRDIGDRQTISNMNKI